MLKEVKIELTNKCSRNCKHCSSNATSSIANKEDISGYDKDEFFDKIFEKSNARLKT